MDNSNPRATIAATLDEALEFIEKATQRLQIAALTPGAMHSDVAEILSYATRAAELADDVLDAIATKAPGQKG